MSEPAIYFDTNHDDDRAFGEDLDRLAADRGVMRWPGESDALDPAAWASLAAAAAGPGPQPMVVHPELYARLQARLAPHVGERNTAETRMSIGNAIHAELEEYLRAGVTPYDHDDRVDALTYAMQSIPPRHAMSQNVPRSRRCSLFARAPRLRAELVDLLTTPDGFPFVA